MKKRLRIFQVIAASTNTSVPGNLTWRRNLYEPLLDLGHDVVLFSAEAGEEAMIRNDEKLRSDFSQRLLDRFRSEHGLKPVDLFFSYLKEGMVDVSVLKEISRTGVPTCNFSCNNAHQFYLVEKLAPFFDYNLHAEKHAGDKFLKIGANPIWWPMASNPKYFKPYHLERTIDVSFVGGNYGVRSRYLAYLLQKGVEVHAYGPGWKTGDGGRIRSAAKRCFYLGQALWHRRPEARARASASLAEHDIRRLISIRFPGNVHLPVSDEELIRLYSRSRISLGILDVYDRHDPSSGILRHLHLREFEAPMCGALYCTGFSEELAEMFEPGREIITYQYAGELLDKVRFYLTHESKGERIREAGRRRALNEHTYHRRFQQLFKAIGLS